MIKVSDNAQNVPSEALQYNLDAGFSGDVLNKTLFRSKQDVSRQDWAHIASSIVARDVAHPES